MGWVGGGGGGGEVKEEVGSFFASGDVSGRFAITERPAAGWWGSAGWGRSEFGVFVGAEGVGGKVVDLVVIGDLTTEWRGVGDCGLFGGEG